jgi:two-component system nitrogen regulation response regulator GlnG/two-component system response regulator HydG
VAYPSSPFAFGGADAHGIVGESPTVWRMRDQLALGAQSPHHVLVTGASGSGKELAARAIHGLSAVWKRPIVARNAATFPEGLVDAELFGTAKNYPHAGSPERPGLIAEADGSTLFLDEIGELPAALQAHLLRVLDQGGEYQRLGESKTRQAKLRVIAATNRDLTTLKHDLAARFAARVEVPALSERREDIPLLVRHVLARLVRESPELRARFFDERDDGEPVARMDPQLIEALLRHDYTHHLRELEKLLWRAVSTSRDTFVGLTPEVSAELRLPPASATSGEDASAEEIRAALAATSGNVTRTAEKLGLKNRYALYRLLKRHGIEVSATDNEAAGPDEDAASDR